MGLIPSYPAGGSVVREAKGTLAKSFRLEPRAGVEYEMLASAYPSDGCKFYMAVIDVAAFVALRPQTVLRCLGRRPRRPACPLRPLTFPLPGRSGCIWSGSERAEWPFLGVTEVDEPLRPVTHTWPASGAAERPQTAPYRRLWRTCASATSAPRTREGLNKCLLHFSDAQGESALSALLTFSVT